MAIFMIHSISILFFYIYIYIVSAKQNKLKMPNACWLQPLRQNITSYSLVLYPGPHCRSEAENRGTVQRASPVPVPGRETPAGQAEDGGTARADKAGWAQGPAQCGDITPAKSYERHRGQTQWTGCLHSTQGECKATLHTDRYLEEQKRQKDFYFQ